MSFITLMYHEIREKSTFHPDHPSSIDVKQAYDDVLPPMLFTTIEQFEEQMAYLKTNNYNVITVKEVKDFYDHKSELPVKSILLTFDDCYQSIKKFVYPILKKYGYSAVAFVVTGWLWDSPKEFCSDKSICLAESELADISDVFEYANHTDSYHQRSDQFTSILMTSKDEEFAKDLDLCNAKEYMKHKDVFAYPFGLYEKRNLSLLQNRGFRLAFTSEPGRNGKETDALLLKRNVVPYSMEIDNFIKMITQ